MGFGVLLLLITSLLAAFSVKLLSIRFTVSTFSGPPFTSLIKTNSSILTNAAINTSTVNFAAIC